MGDDAGQALHPLFHLCENDWMPSMTKKLFFKAKQFPKSSKSKQSEAPCHIFDGREFRNSSTIGY
jgi:hypothetical protein